MRAVIQRVAGASVGVGGEIVGRIDQGLLVLVGVAPTDGVPDMEALANKLVGLRVFADEEGRMNRSVADVAGGILVVSQFTLYGDVRRGRRPSFAGAASPDVAAPLIDELASRLRGEGIDVATGVFGAAMRVELVNDGPVTLVLNVADGRVV